MTQQIKLYQHGNGATVNLLHGWGMNASVFAPLEQQLCPEFCINRIDLPGYGASAPGPEDFDGQIDLLARVLDGGTLVGWSMGGLYAIALAHRFPHKFERLLLVACNPCFVQRDDWQAAMPAETFREFAESLIDDWQATIRRFIGLQMHGADNAREMIRRVSGLLIGGGAPDPASLGFGLDLLLNLDMREALREISIPVMMVLGRRDKLVPISLADQLAQIKAEIHVKCLNRSAHAPFLSHQDEFLELFDEFVKSSPAG